jgi:segregation and condensation protein B
MPLKDIVKATKADRVLVKELVGELVGEYRHRGFRLDEVAGGFAFRTSPAFSPFVRELGEKKPVRMSRAQLETLAIVAYRQPVTRPEVDEVRGVDSGAALKSLLERELVRILGKKDEPGRPMLYGTTPAFLEFFGLRALADLPTLREFTELSDDSRRTFERELGEEPPDFNAPPQPAEGLMGGEGELRPPGDDGAAPAGAAAPVEDWNPSADSVAEPEAEEPFADEGQDERAGGDEGARADEGPGADDGDGDGGERAPDEEREGDGGEGDGDGDEDDGDEDDDDDDDEDEDEDDDDEDEDDDDDDDEDDDEDDDDE